MLERLKEVNYSMLCTYASTSLVLGSTSMHLVNTIIISVLHLSLKQQIEGLRQLQIK